MSKLSFQRIRSWTEVIPSQRIVVRYAAESRTNLMSVTVTPCQECCNPFLHIFHLRKLVPKRERKLEINLRERNIKYIGYVGIGIVRFGHICCYGLLLYLFTTYVWQLFLNVVVVAAHLSSTGTLFHVVTVVHILLRVFTFLVKFRVFSASVADE